MANLPAQTGTVNTAFSFSVASACTPTDGDPITGYSLSSGTLPAGITLNVTLIFSPRQYEAARNAVWRGAQRRVSRERFKSVYSIFVSRVDIYTEKQVPSLSPAAQGQVGIVNAKHIWAANQKFWQPRGLPLQQEMIFASTGVKKAGDAPW